MRCIKKTNGQQCPNESNRGSNYCSEHEPSLHSSDIWKKRPAIRPAQAMKNDTIKKK